MKINSLSKTNKKVNEDVYGYTHYAAWVIDGATGYEKDLLSEVKSDAWWFVQSISKYIKESIDNFDLSIEEVIQNSVIKTKEQYLLKNNSKFDSSQYPSATISLIRINKNNLETFYMGDCSIIIENNSDVQIYEDKRIKDLENITIDKITSYMKKYNTGIEKARSANIGQLKKNRALKNIKYFVLSDEVLVDKAYSDIVPMDQIKSILILSDGFSRIYDVFNHYKTLSGLLNDIKNNSIEYVWNLICKYEKDDYDCIKYPRTKTSDDATAVYIEF